jgi:copper transport protein
LGSTSFERRHKLRATWSWLAAGLALILLAAITQPGLAHAGMMRSDPANHAILMETPAQIRLWFSEDVDPELSSVRVLDENGRVIPVGPTISPDSSRANIVSVSLPKLSMGRYTVIYAIQSRLDGHINNGSITFQVGTAASLTRAVEPPGSGSSDFFAMVGIVLRWGYYVALALLTGCFVIALWVLSPSAISPEPDEEDRLLLCQARQRVWVVGFWSACMAFLANLGLLVWQVSDVMLATPPGVLPYEVAMRFLFHSSAGDLWLIRQALLTAALIVAGLAYDLEQRGFEEIGRDALHSGRARQAQWPGVAGLLLSSGLIAAQASGGHAASVTSEAGLAVALDGLHLLAASCWLGGLLGLRTSLPHAFAGEDDHSFQLTRALWSRFSIIAGVSLATLIATGLYATGEQVASLDALLLTPYGLVLFAKMLTFLLAGAFGLVNAMILHPQFFRMVSRELDKRMGWRLPPLQRLPVMMTIEASTGLLVLLLVGYLAANPSANGPEFRYAGSEQPDPMVQSVAGITGVLAISPNQAGTNLMRVGISDLAGNPPAAINRVIFRLSYQDQPMGTESLDAVQTQPGMYEVSGDQFSLVGDWNVDIVVRRKGYADTILHYDWVVPPLDRRSLISNANWQPALTSVGIFFLGVTLLGAVWLFSHRFQRARLPRTLPQL